MGVRGGKGEALAGCFYFSFPPNPQEGGMADEGPSSQFSWGEQNPHWGGKLTVRLFSPPAPHSLLRWPPQGGGMAGLITLAPGLGRGNKALTMSFPASGNWGEHLAMPAPWLAGWLRGEWEIKWPPLQATCLHATCSLAGGPEPGGWALFPPHFLFSCPGRGHSQVKPKVGALLPCPSREQGQSPGCSPSPAARPAEEEVGVKIGPLPPSSGPQWGLYSLHLSRELTWPYPFPRRWAG